ncbi:MAG: hypothetical protein RTV72_13305 [Candidatus Thorarchaeota archaeon]
MTNLKKTAVMFLTIAMTFSMLMVPFTPITQVTPEIATSQVSTPEDVRMDLEKYIQDRRLKRVSLL